MDQDDSMEQYREVVKANPDLRAGAPEPKSHRATPPDASRGGEDQPNRPPARDSAEREPDPTRFPLKFKNFRRLRETQLSKTWKVFDSERKTDVVLKEPTSRVLADRSAVARFQREVHVASRLLHPNIVPILATELQEPPYFFTMPFIEGLELDAYCRVRKLDVTDRLRLFVKVCRAVGYAHEHAVIHRDLKPNNILVDEDGEPKVLDFGLGCLVDSQSGEGVAESGAIMGAPGYMSPEQASGAPGSTRTDVYGLGVILFQLLTGHLPIEPVKNDLLEMLRRIRDVAPRPPIELNRDINWEVSAVTLKAIAKEPADRYRDADHLADDVENLLEDRPVAAVTPHSLRYRLSKWARRNRVRVSVGGSVAGVLVAFAISGAVLSHRHRVAMETAESAYMVSVARRAIADGDPTTTASILWREQFRFPGLRTRYALWEFYRKYPCVLAVNTGPLRDVEYSPRGRWLATSATDGGLLVLDAKTGARRMSIGGDVARARCLRFAPDGSRVYTGGKDGRVLAWPFEDDVGRIAGRPRLLGTMPSRVNCVAVSPTGRWVAAGSGDPTEVGGKRVLGAEIWLWRIADDDSDSFCRRFPARDGAVLSAAFSTDETQLAWGASDHLNDGAVRLLDLDTGTYVNTTGCGGHRRGLAFSRAGDYLVMGGDDVSIWYPQTRGERALLSGPHGGVRAVELLEFEDRRWITYATGSGCVGIMELVDDNRGAPLAIRGYHDTNAAHCDVCTSPDSRITASAGPDGLKLWRFLPDPALLIHTMDMHDVTALSVSDDGNRIALVQKRSGDGDQLVLLDLANGQKQALPVSCGHVAKCAVSPDGSRVAYYEREGDGPTTLVVVDDQLRTVSAKRMPNDVRPTWLCWPESNRSVLLVALRTDEHDRKGELRVWRFDHEAPDDGGEFEMAHEFDSECSYVAVDASGRSLAACGQGNNDDGRVIVWRSTGRSLGDHPFNEAYKRHVDFPTKRCTWRVAFLGGRSGELIVAATGGDSQTCLWNADSGESVGLLEGHRDSIEHCAPLDERLLVTASRDGTVRVWDTWEREEVCLLHSDPGRTPVVAVRDGRVFISDGRAVRIADKRDIQMFIDGNQDFQRHRLDEALPSSHAVVSDATEPRRLSGP